MADLNKNEFVGRVIRKVPDCWGDSDSEPGPRTDGTRVASGAGSAGIILSSCQSTEDWKSQEKDCTGPAQECLTLIPGLGKAGNPEWHAQWDCMQWQGGSHSTGNWGAVTYSGLSRMLKNSKRSPATVSQVSLHFHFANTFYLFSHK